MAALPGARHYSSTNMKLLSSVTILGANDVKSLLNFYQKIFQFVIIKQRIIENTLEWVHLQSGDTQLMLELSTQKQPDTQSSRLYFYTDDLAAFHHYVLAKGHQSSTLNTTDYGVSEFDLYDPEGHQITVGEYKAEKSAISD